MNQKRGLETEFHFFIMFATYLLLIIVHEAIHGLVWSFFSEGHFRSIEFGVIWSMLTPYCTCLEPLKRNAYILGAMMPTLILGLLPGLVAIFINSLPLLILSLLLIWGGGGDACILLKILRYREEGRDCIYVDHPYECGVVVYERDR